MSFHGKGNDGEALSMVSGEIKWAVSTGGGGGGVGVTVAGLPVSADFETVTAALAANETILNVIGDTTEPSDPQVGASGASIVMFNSSDVSMGVNNFEWTQGSNLEIRGNGKITFAHTVNTTLFDFNGEAGRLTVNGIELDNQSSAITTLTNGIRGRFDNCFIVGDAVFNGTRNSISDCEISLNVIVASGALDTMVSNCNYGGGLVDNGSGTIFADLLSF